MKWFTILVFFSLVACGVKKAPTPYYSMPEHGGTPRPSATPTPNGNSK